MKKIHQVKSEMILSDEPYVHETAQIANSKAGAYTSIGAFNEIVESTIEDYTYTMENVTMNYTEIGKFCSVASHVCINPVNHPMDRVTQHHMTYRCLSYNFSKADDEEIFKWRRSHRVKIGHDVWIGHGAIIMKDVTIGDGAVIASGAVVTKNVEPYTIVGGVPAKKIKERFPKDIAEKLQQIAWWDWSREQLEECFKEFNDLDRFLKTYAQ